MTFFKSKLALSILCVISNISYAQEGEDLDENIYEFNARALFGNENKKVDLKPYQDESSVPEGQYFAQIVLNGKFLTKDMVEFKRNGEKSDLCLNKGLIEKFDLRTDVTENLETKDCTNIKDISKDAFYKFDFSNQTLNISIPLLFLNERPIGYISPNLFSDGVSSVFLNYNYNYYNSRINDDNKYSFDTHYLNVNAGINFNGWFFRHQSSTSHNDSGTSFDSNLNVLYKDLPNNNSRLSLGQFNTSTYYLESLPIIGAQIATDNMMRPSSQRSYAPVIENVANSNAVVSIYQNGRKLLERTVPAGPFKITDLTAFSGSGDLTVNIIENTGEKRTFIVPLQNNTNLVRQGQFNHSISVGRYRLQDHTTNNTVGQLSLEYGLNNFATLHAGTNVSNIYQSYLLGGALNTFIGGFNVLTEISHAKIYDNWLNGERYRANYSYNLNNWGTTYLNAFYLNQSRKYKSVSNTFSYDNKDRLTDSELDDFLLTNNLKQQYGFSIGQSLPNQMGSINFNLFRSNYWNNNKTYNQFAVSYGNNWNKISYNIGYSNNENQNQSTDKIIYISMSAPLEWRENRVNLNANVQRMSADKNTLYSTVNMSSVLGNNNQFSYSLGANNTHSDGNSDTYVGGQLTYRLPQATLGATFSALGDNKQYSLSASGALVAHSHGITLTNYLNDTFAIAHIKNGAGAEIQNAAGIRFDRWGNAIYSNMNPYDENILKINPSALPINVSMDSTQSTVIPRRYSSAMVVFDAMVNSNVILVLSLKDDQMIPIGTELKDNDNNKIGVVGQSNQVLVSSLDQLKKTPILKWSDESDQMCSLTSLDMDKEISSTHFNIINAECN